jgi:hypothetical protein
VIAVPAGVRIVRAAVAFIQILKRRSTSIVGIEAIGAKKHSYAEFGWGVARVPWH